MKFFEINEKIGNRMIVAIYPSDVPDGFPTYRFDDGTEKSHFHLAKDQAPFGQYVISRGTDCGWQCYINGGDFVVIDNVSQESAVAMRTFLNKKFNDGKMPEPTGVFKAAGDV